MGGGDPAGTHAELLHHAHRTGRLLDSAVHVIEAVFDGRTRVQLSRP